MQKPLALITTLCLGAVLLVQFQSCTPNEAFKPEAPLSSQVELAPSGTLSYSSLGKSDIRGGIFGLDKEGRLHFWAMDMFQPEKRLTVTLKINGASMGNDVANRSHPFIKELLSGPGDHNYAGRLLIPLDYQTANTRFTAELYVDGSRVIKQSYNPNWQFFELKQTIELTGDVLGTDNSEHIACSGSCSVRSLLGNDNLIGSDQNDSFWANDGNDVLFGHKGDDHLDGGSGDDTIIPGNGLDTIVFKQTTSNKAEFDGVIQNVANSDKITCPTEKPTHCIDSYSQRILIFPSKSALTLKGVHREESNISDCINTCTGLTGLYPGMVIVTDGSSVDKNRAPDHIKGTNSDEVFLPQSGRNTLIEGGGGNDVYVLQNTHGHHVVLDTSGSNSIRCLNMRVAQENMEDGVRLSWNGGSLNIPHHSEVRFRRSDGSLNADCQFIDQSELGQGVM